MKQNSKRLVLGICMAVCLLSLSACGAADEKSSSVDASMSMALQQQTAGLLENIASIPAADMSIVIEQNREGGAEALAAGLESYQALLDDLGAFVSTGDGFVEEIKGGYSITVNSQFAKRPVEFVITLDKDMVNITSMTFNPVYTTGEKLAKAGMNTLMGMGTVFIVLIFISLLIGCFRYINKWEENMKNKKNGGAPALAESPASAPAFRADENLVDDLDLVAVITAAIAASENTSADGLVVRSIRRASAGKWKRA